MTIEQAIKDLRAKGKSASIITVSNHIHAEQGGDLQVIKQRTRKWLFNAYPNACTIIERI